MFKYLLNGIVSSLKMVKTENHTALRRGKKRACSIEADNSRHTLGTNRQRQKPFPQNNGQNVKPQNEQQHRRGRRQKAMLNMCRTRHEEKKVSSVEKTACFPDRVRAFSSFTAQWPSSVTPCHHCKVFSQAENRTVPRGYQICHTSLLGYHASQQLETDSAESTNNFLSQRPCCYSVSRTSLITGYILSSNG